MSSVSAITLHTSCIEECTEDGKILIIDRINEWLRNANFAPLLSVEDAYGGSKHPQVLIYGAGFNYFPETEFATFILSLPWECPENVVLLINPEEGSTKIFRPQKEELITTLPDYLKT